MSTTIPRVGILMGSDSDWPKIKAAADALAEKVAAQDQKPQESLAKQ